MKSIFSYLRNRDPILGIEIEKLTVLKEFKLEKSADYFVSLCREIIGQQLSGKVAEVIFERFIKLFLNKIPTPEKVLKLEDLQLRTVGMSWSKVKFLKDLAEKVNCGALDLDKLNNLSDVDVTRELLQVKGIGPWTAEMFLMFSLAREDVFSLGDLGLKNAIMRLYKLPKKPSNKFMAKISKKWAPYRTYACLILWHSIDSKPV